MAAWRKAYCTFCNKEIMKIGTRARARQKPRERAARALLIYFAVTKSTVRLYIGLRFTAVYTRVCTLYRLYTHSCVLEYLGPIYSCTVLVVTAK